MFIIYKNGIGRKAEYKAGWKAGKILKPGRATRGKIMELKVDENGKAILEKGNPVYVHPDGKEIPVDAKRAFTKIRDLGEENRDLREKYKAVNSVVEQLDGLDIQEAKKALEIVKNMESKKLVDAGKVDEIAESYRQNLDSTRESYESKLKTLSEELEKQKRSTEEAFILSALEGSKVLKETFIPPDFVLSRFRENLGVDYTEDGKPIIFGLINGKKIYSRENAGEIATGEEVFETILGSHPKKDTFTKASLKGGSGGGPGSGTNNSNDLQAQLVAAQKAGDIQKVVSITRKLYEQRQ